MISTKPVHKPITFEIAPENTVEDAVQSIIAGDADEEYAFYDEQTFERSMDVESASGYFPFTVDEINLNIDNFHSDRMYSTENEHLTHDGDIEMYNEDVRCVIYREKKSIEVWIPY